MELTVSYLGEAMFSAACCTLAFAVAATALHDPHFHGGGMAGGLELATSDAEVLQENLELKAELKLRVENQELSAENLAIKSTLQQIADILEDHSGGTDSDGNMFGNMFDDPDDIHEEEATDLDNQEFGSDLTEFGSEDRHVSDNSESLFQSDESDNSIKPGEKLHSDFDSLEHKNVLAHGVHRFQSDNSLIVPNTEENILEQQTGLNDDELKITETIAEEHQLGTGEEEVELKELTAEEEADKALLAEQKAKQKELDLDTYHMSDATERKHLNGEGKGHTNPKDFEQKDALEIPGYPTNSNPGITNRQLRT